MLDIWRQKDVLLDLDMLPENQDQESQKVPERVLRDPEEAPEDQESKKLIWSSRKGINLIIC